MNHTYAVLGAGMQGTAVAYDLALFGHAKAIMMGDADLAQATQSAYRVNALTGNNLCHPYQVDALDAASLRPFLDPADVLISCVPYWMHPQIAPIAIATHTNMIDLGGDTRVARKTLAFHHDAAQAGVTIVPDTGLAPGLVNNLGNYLIESFEKPISVRLFCGGLPQHPKPPFNYKLVFNIEGLITEYMDEADVVRNCQLQKVPTLEELETLHVDGLGQMEAFITSGGTSTAPETWEGKLETYEYKTIRYPGHCQLMKIFKQFGFWGQEEIPVRSGTAKPREVFCSLMNPALKDPTDQDLVVVQAIGKGKNGTIEETLQLDILQKFDPKTGFSAMEQLTGFSSSIYAIAIAEGEFPHGCLRYEKAMHGHTFVDRLRRRGIEIRESN